MLLYLYTFSIVVQYKRFAEIVSIVYSFIVLLARVCILCGVLCVFPCAQAIYGNIFLVNALFGRPV